MRSSGLIALAASLSAASAAVLQGFNYGSTQTDGSVKVQSDFQAEFSTAKGLVGTNGAFTSARLYTMIQGGTTNTPTSAIPAAIAEGTSLLLGLWGSGGQDFFNTELAALSSAISQYGSAFTSLVIGISVGSEDLYRVSPIGIENMSGVGANPDTIVSYISQLRSAISGTALSGAPVGHVDTWTAWVNGSNSAVVTACDWIGTDAYPYFQNTMANGIESGASLFETAYSNVQAVSQGKPVWITETGWPVSGSTSNLAVPSTTNAKTYWDEVGCGFSFGKINTFWFTLQDAYPTTPDPSFGVVGATLTTTPLYDLSCSNVTSSSSSSSVASSSTAVSSSASSVASSVSASVTASSSAASVASSSLVVPTSVSGGLSPSQGAGNGIGSASSGASSKTVATSVITGSAGSSAAVVPVATGVTSIKPSGAANATVSTPAASARTTFTGAAAAATGSFVGALGAVVAIMAAL